ncbi:MAG: Gfo/Idh/MocA family oxidoreductase [Haliscomenobacter sp.]|uniref:Gfo/Idh/MocA family protein n=1 Tax=Haliscomenobacter sp. TaxID=2717303 RepID=UPI0029BB3082|nr:Gfo/Idh/MocA family oxidoreductase [Haliscomenobacter sp.]MDX2070036.1 Gfo/Idh/MocA family oxidoreductase [Haliscomenobacter sp.]
MKTRRTFIKNTATALGGLGLMEFLPLEAIVAIRKAVAPSDKINVGLIGVKNQGFNNIRAFLKINDVNLTAICDVDDAQLAKRKDDLSKAGVPNLKLYKDYRKMLEDKDLDAVLVATPDHWHCLQLTDSLSAGKHVYVEKPVANSIGEAKAMIRATEASGKVVQVNQWQRSQKHFKDAIAFVKSGQLGPIINTKTWMYRGTQPLPVVANSPVPEGVDYKMWLGPAQMRDFNANRFHYEFRWFWDYAGGLMCDWGVHLLDIMLWGMGVNEPLSVSAVGGKRIFPTDARETPDYIHVTYDFGTFTNTWEHYMGTGAGQYGKGHGIAFIGIKGTLVVTRNGWEVIPEKDGAEKFRMEGVELQPKADNGLDLHAQNFVDVMKSGKREDLACPIHAGATVAVNAHMGNVAYRTGEKIYWDAAKGKFNSKKANALILPKYHNGFDFPKV